MSFASAAIKRLSNEHRHMMKEANRVKDFYAAPLPENLFEWHFTIRGPGGEEGDLPYAKGLYHGALLFTRSYPLEPPDIMFFTKNGRFSINEKICSTISSYHPELWQPTYDIAFTLTALRLFMAQENEIGVGAYPKDLIPLEAKREWAAATWNYTCPTCHCKLSEVWATEMEPFAEISPEKVAQVPTLPPKPPAGAAVAPAPVESDAEVAGTQNGEEETAVVQQEEEEEEGEKEEEEREEGQSGEEMSTAVAAPEKVETVAERDEAAPVTNTNEAPPTVSIPESPTTPDVIEPAPLTSGASSAADAVAAAAVATEEGETPAGYREAAPAPAPAPAMAPPPYIGIVVGNLNILLVPLFLDRLVICSFVVVVFILLRRLYAWLFFLWLHEIELEVSKGL